ncbi:MAG: hypothetical protein JWP00_3814 [Chloroflexi bacterium]|jgi:hypothetical protein|nr:hypothetical protein [Chloroflexota bacterium]
MNNKKAIIPSKYNLEAVKRDLWKVLEAAPHEVPAIRQAIIEGEVDGGFYRGECCCIIGILSKNLGVPVMSLSQAYGILPDPHSPMEIFLYNIVEGDTPETSVYSRAVLNWCDEFLAELPARQAARLQEAVQADIEAILADVLPGEAGERELVKH